LLLQVARLVTPALRTARELPSRRKGQVTAMIDVHVHLGRAASGKEPPVTEEELLRRMNELGIQRAVILPLVSPEVMFAPFTTEDALEAAARHPDRLLAFCNVDPRCGTNSPDMDFSWMLQEYKDAGCLGLGEVTANLAFDEPLCLNLYRHCGRVGFPVLFHMATRVSYGLYGLADEIGLPRLERSLRECPETIFIGHAMAFWAEISADVDEQTRGGYPKEPVRKFGRVPELMAKYPNLYADISAGSGFNALTREPEFGYRFLEEHQDKLLFGTDICHVNQDVPIVPWFNNALSSGKISRTCYDKVARKNAERLLGLT
jgi:hypothetical protein